MFHRPTSTCPTCPTWRARCASPRRRASCNDPVADRPGGLMLRAPSLRGGTAGVFRSTSMVAQAPWPLLLAAGLVAGLAVLPLAYLVIRALDADPGSLDLVLRPRTAVVAASTVGLALLVGAGTIALG